MFCMKCGMPTAICICNILPLVGGEGGEAKKVKDVVVSFEDGTIATFQPGVETPAISNGPAAAAEG